MPFPAKGRKKRDFHRRILALTVKVQSPSQQTRRKYALCVNGICFRIPEGFAANKSGDQERIELHEGEAVGFEEQLQVLPIVTGGFNPYLLFSFNIIQ